MTLPQLGHERRDLIQALQDLVCNGFTVLSLRSRLEFIALRCFVHEAVSVLAAVLPENSGVNEELAKG